jgi:hypothetical protein
MSRDRILRGLLWGSLALGTALALVVCSRIAAQSIVVGSVEGRWVYGYLQPVSLRLVATAALAIVVSCGALAAGTLLERRSDWWLVLGWMGVGLGVQALLRLLTPFTFERIFVSDSANSFYTVTRQFFPDTVLREFNDARTYWPLHAQSNMPGKLMLLYALREVSRRPDVLPWLVVIVSNAGGVLMYGFVRDLLGDRRAALFSLVLYLFVPAKLYFFPLLNTVTPVVILLCAWLALAWFRTAGTVYAALLGVALYGLVFFEPLPLVMGLLFAVLAGRALWRGDITWRRLATQGAIAVLAFGATYAAVSFRYGFDLFPALRTIGAHAVEFNATAGRPYAIWARENLREFTLGVGICQAILFCAALGDGLWRSDPAAPRLTRPIVVLCLSLFGVLIATDLIGINRGEVTRLWIFLACFFQIPAAYVCASLHSRAALGVVLATTLLQGALGTAMIGFILPG